MFSKSIHNTIFVRTLLVAAIVGPFGGCGEIPDAPVDDTDGAFALTGADEETGTDEGASAGQSGGDELGAEADTSEESSESEGTGETTDTGDDSGGPAPADPDESRLDCVDADDEVLGTCDDDSPLHNPCDAAFALECQLQGGELNEPTSEMVWLVPCSHGNPLLHACDDNFSAGCQQSGGSFTCYWEPQDVCIDGHCEWSPIPQ